MAVIRSEKEERLPLPVGISDYRLASLEYYYVDKTMMIKEFLDERPMVSLFTRPRRFGKTLNMNMLRTFFEQTGEDTSAYFKDKKIWGCGKKYREYQGKYPVIFVTFKDVKFETWEETFAALKDVFSKEAYRHMELQDSGQCDAYDKRRFERILAGEVNEVELSGALADLSRMLHRHWGTAPIIIIDEYDIPIQQGYMSGYYGQVILFMRNLFSGGLKDNRHLSYGFLTGVLRVAKESIFSGLNNLAIYSVLDHKYSAYFGFTPEEVREMAAYYGGSDRYEEICEWYDGYRFGRTEIFNPWSVISYFHNECEPRSFWQSTIYSFLLVAGYLKPIKATVSFDGDFMCEVTLPNKEIAFVYNKEILQKLHHIIPPSAALAVQESIYSGDGARLQKQIQTLLTQSVSYYDTAGENFYHGFMLGLCALLGGCYTTSNRESGDGRYDIQLMPENDRLPGILIEMKAEKNCTEDGLKRLSKTALRQIKDKKYDMEMRAKGIAVIYRYGVAFCGSNVEVAVG